MADIVLSPREIEALTGYKRPTEQLSELKRQGYWRARRAASGAIVLERAHYEAVAAGGGEKERPRVKHPVSRRTAAA